MHRRVLGHFSRVTQRMLVVCVFGTCFYDHPVRPDWRERFPCSLVIWAVTGSLLENSTSLKPLSFRSQFLDIVQHLRTWIRSEINLSKEVTPRMYLIISQVRELPTQKSFR